MKRTEATDDVIVCLARETCIAVSATDPEVSDLIVVVDVVLDEVAVRSQMPTKRTDARLSPSESETTESPQWPKGFWGQIGVGCRLRLVVSENETVTGSANASVIVIGNETETTIDPPDRAVMTTATMNANEGTGKMSGRGLIAAALIADHTRNSTMETSDPPVPDAVDPMTKTKMLPAIHAMPRYGKSPKGSDISTRLTK